MTDEINVQESDNARLAKDNKELSRLLSEANDVIDAIKKGNIDAVFVASKETARVLVTNIADHTYRAFIENMLEGIVTIHADGVILYCNSSFARIINLPLQKIIGTNFRRFIPPEFTDHFESFFTEHLDVDSKIELSLLDHKGVRAHFVISLNRIRLHGYEALNLVMTDITNLKKTEEKLMIVKGNLKLAIDRRRSSESKIVSLNKELVSNVKVLKAANTELEMFAYIASHDLQEPLRKIGTYTSLLVRDYYNDINQQGQHYVDIIKKSSDRMRTLITDILEYSGLSHKYLFELTNLESIVNEVLLTLEIVINETKATIIIEKQLPEIEANAAQMRQLFQNLISNSLKFIKAGVQPVIWINYEIVNGSEIAKMMESRFNEKFCIFSVRDNGIGFNPAYSDRIFNIFQRLNNSSVYQGTGIGLAICKKVVEQHKGFITAQGNHNEGALFTITLPIVQHREPEDEVPVKFESTQ